ESLGQHHDRDDFDPPVPVVPVRHFCLPRTARRAPHWAPGRGPLYAGYVALPGRAHHPGVILLAGCSAATMVIVRTQPTVPPTTRIVLGRTFLSTSSTVQSCPPLPPGPA